MKRFSVYNTKNRLKKFTKKYNNVKFYSDEPKMPQLETISKSHFFSNSGLRLNMALIFSILNLGVRS